MSAKNIHTREFHTRWISDGIGEDYKAWSIVAERDSISRVYIESPTGTGKTTFILEQLFPYAAQQNRHILYLSNRNILSEQTKYTFVTSKLPASERTAPPLQDIQTIMYPATYPNQDYPPPTVTFLNYQSIFALTKNMYPYSPPHPCHLNTIPSFLPSLYYSVKSSSPICSPTYILPIYNPFYYVILDEAHFFVEDALFNPLTQMLLERIITRFYYSTLIFMSATMEETIEPLLNSLKRYRPPNQVTQAPFYDIYFNHDVFYHNSYCEANYRLSFFYKYEEIISRIMDGPDDEKWLIFVSSKQEGQGLAKQIQAIGRTAAFLSTEKKESKQWKTLVEESRFKETVLIATTVLDNGANITDSSVKHVVLPFCDRTCFLQMLGRRRTTGAETLQVYARYPTIQTLNSQLRLMQQLRTAMDPLLKNINEIPFDTMTHLLQNYWLKRDPNINSLFYIDSQRRLVPNWLAYDKICHLKEFYSDLKEHSTNPLYYQRIVQSWLGLDTTNQPDFLSVHNYSSLDALITDYLNQPIAQDAQKQFYQDFLHHYKIQCHEQFRDNPSQRKQALNIRKGKTQRKATINRSLTALGLPYRLDKQNNYWILRQYEPTASSQD